MNSIDPIALLAVAGLAFTVAIMVYKRKKKENSDKSE